MQEDQEDNNDSFIINMTKQFGDCNHDYYTFVSLILAMVAMVFGNGLLLYSVLKTFRSSRTDTVVLNQAVVDVVYCALFPIVILDSRREITNLSIFVFFKVLEDTLLTLSVLAVLIVNVHKYLYIKSTFLYSTKVTCKMVQILIGVTWLLTPIGFTIRNLHFTCRRNRPCGSSYMYCLAASGAGEIGSIIFYVSSTVVIIGLNIRLVIVAIKFQNECQFAKTSAEGVQEVRKICRQNSASRSSRYYRQLKIVVYPLLSNLLVLLTISPFWVVMAICQLGFVCMDVDHSLFYLMRLHSMFNPYCTLMTHRKYRNAATSIRLQTVFAFGFKRGGESESAVDRGTGTVGRMKSMASFSNKRLLEEQNRPNEQENTVFIASVC